MITNSFEETQRAGAEFALRLHSGQARKSAVVLALSGDLGAGKTNFLQGFAKGLGIEEIVNSPTFIVMKKFQIPNYKSQINPKFEMFYHFDLYRLENEKDLDFLNIKEIVSDPKNIVAIEWPEKIGGLLPKNAIKINLNHLQENKREIVIQY